MLNAAGKSFRKGISLLEIAASFPDDATAECGVDKIAVNGACNRVTDYVSAVAVTCTAAGTLQGFVADHAARVTTAITDEHRGYRGIPHPYRTAKHYVSQYVNGMAHTNGMRALGGALMRDCHETFHHVSLKHPQRYVSEFATHHNLRARDTATIMRETVVRVVGKRLTYAALTVAPLPGPNSASGRGESVVIDRANPMKQQVILPGIDVASEQIAVGLLRPRPQARRARNADADRGR